MAFIKDILIRQFVGVPIRGYSELELRRPFGGAVNAKRQEVHVTDIPGVPGLLELHDNQTVYTGTALNNEVGIQDKGSAVDIYPNGTQDLINGVAPITLTKPGEFYNVDAAIDDQGRIRRGAITVRFYGPEKPQP